MLFGSLLCHRRPRVLKALNHLIQNPVWIFWPSSLKRGRNGNPANPFASNSCNSNSTPRWRKPNAIRASGNAIAISSRKLHLAFPHKLPTAGGTLSLSDYICSPIEWWWCPCFYLVQPKITLVLGSFVTCCKVNLILIDRM